MNKFRKFLIPDYGDVAPEVEIGAPQILDLENPDIWRTQSDLESVAAMTANYKKCNCYNKVMSINRIDTSFIRDGAKVPIRIYNTELNENTNVLIYFHGGSFSMNHLDVYEYVCRYLALVGNLIVVSVDYRLAPENKFPCGLEDSYAALEWVKDNIYKYGGNPDRISVAGDSSGGNFAAVISIMARDRKGPKIDKQILFYPLTSNYAEEITESEKRYGDGYFLEYYCKDDPMSDYFPDGVSRKNPLTSPLFVENAENLPPACFISAECDPLLDQGLMYAAKLQDAGNKVEYHIMKGMIHGFLNQTYGESFKAMQIAADFINAPFFN